jgi:hypothetical protein
VGLGLAIGGLGLGQGLLAQGEQEEPVLLGERRDGLPEYSMDQVDRQKIRFSKRTNTASRLRRTPARRRAVVGCG